MIPAACVPEPSEMPSLELLVQPAACLSMAT